MIRALAALALLAAIVPPKPKAPAGVGLTVAGDTVTAAWVYRWPGILAGDTARAQFSQRTATASAFVNLPPTQPTTTTSVSRAITAPAAGSFDSVKVCAWVTRPGTSASPTTCAKTRREGPPILPSPGVDSLTITPGQVTIEPGASVLFTIRSS